MIIPQMIKTLKTKSTEGVSLGLFVIYLIANIFALIYAFMITQPPLILKYEIGIMTTIFYLTLYYIYSKNNFKKLHKNLKIKTK